MFLTEKIYLPKILQILGTKTQMNPHTYSLSRRRAQEALSYPTYADLIKSVFTQPINTALAFAIVLFMVGSVAGVTAVAYAELSNAGLASQTPSPQSRPKTSVLGMAIYGQLVCGYRTANCLNYMLNAHDGENWQVRIDYQLEGNIVGVIRVNGWKFMDNLRGSGSGYTGYDLEPGETYNFVLYRQAGRRLVRVTNMRLTMPELDPVFQIPPSPPELPPGPAYGYQSVDTGSSGSGWHEGWIEKTFTSNYGNAPANVTVSGWAYDQSNKVDVSIKLKNENTGEEYRPSNIQWRPFRLDVADYLADKPAGANTSGVNGMFEAVFDSLPAGNYTILSARYDGYLFNVQSYYIQITNAPAYGYQNPSYVMAPVVSGPSSVLAGSSASYTFTTTANSGNFVSYSIDWGDGFTTVSREGYGSGTGYITSHAWSRSGLYTITVTATPTVGSYTKSTYQVRVNEVSVARVGQLINNHGTVQIVALNGLYGFTDFATFYSWGYSFSQVVPANSAEKAMSQVGFVPLKNPNCNSPLDQIAGSCGAKASNPLTVEKNSGFSTPSYSPGAASAKVGSFTFTASGGDAAVSQFTLSTGPDVAGQFQNLTLRRADTNIQIGQTQAALMSNSSYSIVPSAPIIIASGSVVTFDVLADVTTSATAGTKLRVVSLTGCSATPLPENFSQVCSGADGQDVVINGQSSAGSLIATLDASNPLSRSVAAGTTDVDLMRVRLNSTNDDMNLTQFTVYVGGSAASASNLYLYENSTRLSTIVANVNSNNTFYLNSNSFIIPKNSSRTLSLRADIPSTVVVGQISAHLQAAHANAASTGIRTAAAFSSVAGNLMTISATSAGPKITSKPAVSSSISAGQTASFTFWASSPSISWGIDWDDGIKTATLCGDTSNQFYTATHAWDMAGGTYNVKVTLSDCKGGTDTYSFNVSTVSISPLTITTGSLPEAIAGQVYSANAQATGGSAPYSWSVVSTTYPASCCILGLDGSTGTFTTQTSPTISTAYIGSYSWTVEVTDSNGAKATKTVSLKINPPTGTASLNVSPASLTFTAVQGTNPAQQTLRLENTSSQSLNWIRTSSVGWLSTYGSAGTMFAAPNNVNPALPVTIDATGLAAGTYTGTLTFSPNPSSASSFSTFASQTVSVTLTITAPATLTPTYRYLKVQSTSNSWLAWSEIQAIDSAGNVLTPVNCEASATYSIHTCDKAYPGVGSYWNAGGNSGYIILDYGSAKNITQVKLLTNNSPDPATATHEVLLSSDKNSYASFKTFSGQIANQLWLVHPQ